MAKLIMNQQVHLTEYTPNTLLINESLSKNLNLKINEKIKVQNQLFTIIGIVKSVPDVSGFVAFGDWALAG